MGKLSYRLFILFYSIFIRFASLFNQKARLFLRGRKNLLPRLEQDLKQKEVPLAWFHCASLGEFEQGRPIIESFRKQFPQYEILLTFFSPSGYEVRKNYDQADYIYYLPIDSAYNATKFLDITNPELAIFVKYEFWHYYLKELNQRNIPILSVSSIFRADQIYFKGYGSFQRKILSHVTHFFVQDLNSKKLLDSISINDVTVSGDTRFDRVASIVKQKKDISHIDSFKGTEKLFIVGSCWPEDFDVLLPLINDSSIKFIIAPHEIENKFMNKIENEVARKAIRYSQVNDSTDLSDHQVMIIDNVGMLSSLYGYGDFAYIGGAFGQGLHNILEAATFGLPIFFGNKNYTKFREAVDLVNLGGAVAVDNYDELRSQFYQFMQTKTYTIASKVNEDYVKGHIGATDKIIQYCKTVCNEG